MTGAAFYPAIQRCSESADRDSRAHIGGPVELEGIVSVEPAWATETMPTVILDTAPGTLRTQHRPGTIAGPVLLDDLAC